jgi:exonuclease III
MARSHESRVAPGGALAGVPPPAPLTVGSWNVNSVRARLPRLLGWLARRRPDVACLQETNTWWDYREGRSIADGGARVSALRITPPSS